MTDPTTEYGCNGICVTAAEVGLYVAGNPVAYPHPECDKHGIGSEGDE